MSVDSRHDPLTRLELAGLWTLLIVCVAFGGVTLLRSAFLTHRHTDLEVYLRAAWAVRVGVDPYHVADSNGWHYHYPPLLAIALIPGAVAPPGTTGDGPIPYPVAVVLAYVASLSALVAGLWRLAAALARHRGKPDEPWSRNTWQVVAIPTLACLAGVGSTLGRGQPNLLLVACVCWSGATALDGRRLAAGVWIGLGACIKPFLLVLLVLDVARRDARRAMGVALGVALGLGVLPALVVGPSDAIGLSSAYARARALPALAGTPDPAIEGELDPLRGRFVGYAPSLFKALHVDPTAWPRRIDRSYWIVGAAIAAVLATPIVVAAARRAERASPALEPLLAGALLIAIVPALPSCKSHYYALAVPLAAGLVARVHDLREHGLSSRAPLIALGIHAAVQLAGWIPWPVDIGARGAFPLASVLLIAMAIREVWRSGPEHRSETQRDIA